MWRSFEITICVGVLLAIASAASACMFFRDRFIDRELSGAVTLEQEWLELTPGEPLKVQRDTQEITLSPEDGVRVVGLNVRSGENIFCQEQQKRQYNYRTRPGHNLLRRLCGCA